MVEVMIKSGIFKKRIFKINKDTQTLIRRISEEYKLSEDEIIRMSINNEKVPQSGDAKKIESLKKEIDELNKRMFILEGEWSAMRYKAHTLANDNKMLAVVLTGLLSQNKTLRRQLGLKIEYNELRELIDYYLFQVRGSRL